MIGTRVGHLRIISLLGQGGMGDVYLGYDERLQRRVALKSIRKEMRLSAVSRQRFLREARALSALDHPNICRIYDYAEGSSCDFLVLELVEGTTLERAIEQGMSRTRKLRIARDILEALAAAHRRGIVHRDLKPDNVMITAGGTVKILDFGIARAEGTPGQTAWSEADDVESADTLILDRPAAGSTIVAGTPLYMSPEQARGATITTATDLYSFGLLLQMLLTEHPPRRDGNRDEVLRAAAAGERLPMTGQPRPLAAFVARLTSVAPADRPTAVEALATLDRILALPARRARIAAAAVLLLLLLAGAVKYGIDVTTARRDAERRRNQAEELVSFMVQDLPEKLEPVGRLDVLDSAATKALAYFESLSPEEMQGEELRRHARALTQLGGVRMKQGKLPDALALFRQSLRFAETAARLDPENDEAQLALSNSHFWIGDALRRQGDAKAALAHLQAYYAVSARLAAKHPGNRQYEAELSYGHSNLGSVYEALGDWTRAGAEYQTAAEVDRRRAARDPGNPQTLADLANSLNKLGVLRQTNGDLTGARAAIEEDVAIRRKLAAAAPDDARRASRLAVSLAFLGSIQLDLGEAARAEGAVREELAIAARLAARDEQNLDGQRARAVAQVRLAETLLSLRRDAEAGPLLDAATATLVRLTEADARPTWQRDLAAAFRQRARMLIRGGDRTGAAENGEKAVMLAERARAKQTADVSAARVLCDALMDLAELEQSARPESARVRAERVVALAGTPPFDRDLRVQDSAARALALLGRADEASQRVTRLVSAGYRRADFAGRWRIAASPP